MVMFSETKARPQSVVPLITIFNGSCSVLITWAGLR
jgi:hypothetical protein